MNVLDLIREVERQGGSVGRDGEQLVLRSPSPLPAHLIEQLSKNKSAVMVALGAPVHQAVDAGDLHDALDALRNHLTPSLSVLSDGQLLALVRHAVSSARELARGKYGAYCRWCGLALSVIAVSDSCGFCATHRSDA